MECEQREQILQRLLGEHAEVSDIETELHELQDHETQCDICLQLNDQCGPR